MTATARIRVSFAPQEGPQAAYIDSPFDITVYGGARGGGKTFGSLGDFFIHAMEHGVDARGLMVRKTREDLNDTIAIAEVMYAGTAKWTDKGSFFRFSNGARLYCAYLERDQDAEHYQGWSLTRIYVEELTQFPQAGPVLRLLGALRSAKGIRCQMRCTCNPGGPGHLWVKAWVIDNGPYRPHTDPLNRLTRVFIPATVDDNPALLANDPHYLDRLAAVGSEQLVRAWRFGDWNVVEGSFFPEFTRARHVIPPFQIPKWWTRLRAADWGSAKPFSIGWYAVVQDDRDLDDGRVLPRGAIVRYREYYGMKEGEPNVGLKLAATAVAREIVSRETSPSGKREEIEYGVMDPSAFNVVSGRRSPRRC
jgi:hypothetical protein